MSQMLAALQFLQSASRIFLALDKQILLPHAAAKRLLPSEPSRWNRHYYHDSYVAPANKRLPSYATFRLIFSIASSSFSQVTRQPSVLTRLEEGDGENSPRRRLGVWFIL
ncbi:hypothetical protein EV702DRAFT_1145575 [Suillus placidus]|uniref:Uncharacterized protein n=1 Tax=Suillus placidus TaxID=48579 RepID=A0A9P7CXI0_9AGAM|nr:hypothetical protein EV702DRAFT_1145575 [Suillus placidus]